MSVYQNVLMMLYTLARTIRWVTQSGVRYMLLTEIYVPSVLVILIHHNALRFVQ